MNRHRFLAGIIVASALFGLVSCSKKGPAAVPGGKSIELKVGGVLSLTGGAAAYGGDAEKGVKLALDEINASYSPVRVTWTALDDKSDKTEAARVARQLIDVDHVQIILGPAISPSALVVGKLCEERGVPMVSTSATQDEVTASDCYDRQFVSRVCFSDSYQGLVLAQFAARDLKMMKAAIVFDKTLSYSIGLARTFRAEFEKLGGKIRYEENYSVKDTDYSALIDKVAAFDVELLFFPGWDENVGPMLRQAGNKWDKFTLLGSDAWPSNRLLELAGGNIKKAYALSHFIAGDPNPKVSAFTKAFRSKYNEEASPFAALGYDAMMLIYDAAQRAGSHDPAALKDAINSTQGLELVTGQISFNEQRNPQKDVVIVQIFPHKISFFKRVRSEF